MTELGEGVNGEEDEGDLDLGDKKEYVEEDEGGLDDGVVDHERRVLQRFGGGAVEGL
jgi:hypothetical protein